MATMRACAADIVVLRKAYHRTHSVIKQISGILLIIIVTIHREPMFKGLLTYMSICVLPVYQYIASIKGTIYLKHYHVTRYMKPPTM